MIAFAVLRRAESAARQHPRFDRPPRCPVPSSTDRSISTQFTPNVRLLSTDTLDILLLEFCQLIRYRTLVGAYSDSCF